MVCLILAIFNFNSTMVRLRSDDLAERSEAFSDFNSTMVRLRLASFPCHYMFFLFQFHNGAIKMTISRKRQDLKIPFQFHNGAIKMTRSCVHGFFDKLFQFHNGAIKICLFSNLMITASSFQFHNGAIKIRGQRYPRLMGILISIPQWCD